MDQNEHSRLFSGFPPVTTDMWEQRIQADLKGADYHKKLIWQSGEGFEVKPYYRSEDLQGMEYLHAMPGEFPYIRGNEASGNPWLIRQDIEESNPETAREEALEAISKGVGYIGLNVRKISTHQEMSRLLRGIDITKTSVHLFHTQSYPLALELFIYEVKDRGIPASDVTGSLNFDPLGYLLLHGDYYHNWKQNMEEAEYILQTIKSKLPSFRAINLNGHIFQNSGSTLVQELAFTMAMASEYLAGLTAKGMDIDDIAPRFMISFATGPNYFMEIAKLRAARWLWARIVEQFHPLLESSLKVFIHATTAAWNKSVFDPYVNMLRTTTEGMSAIIGNADSVTLMPFNASYRNPDTFSNRIARNQQLILREESFLDKIADPSAGSYYIENLTNAIAQNAFDLFRDVESRGGFNECIREGYIQQLVEASRSSKETDIARRRIIMLGTNQYPNPNESMAGQIDERQEKSPEEPSKYRKLAPFRAASRFEAMRLATERYIHQGNKRPAVFLFTIGNLAMLRARAGFAANFFGCAGYEIIDNQGFANVAEGVEAAVSSAAEIIVICSSDEEYVLYVPDIAKGLSASGKKHRLVVAGYPKDHAEAFRASGVDGFIHVKSDLLETLLEYQEYLSIK